MMRFVRPVAATLSRALAAHSIAVLLIACSAAPSLAQDMNMPMTTASDFAMTNLNTALRDNLLGIDQRGPVRGPRRLPPPAVDRQAYFAPASLAYRPTGDLARSTVAGFVKRLRRKDPEASAAVGEQFSRHDYGSIYRNLAGPFGLRSDNAADALAAYTILGWMIANNAGDPSRGTVLAVRDQIGARLAADPVLRSPRNRARTGEEFKLLFVTLHSGWQSARREGNLRQYADGVATMFRNQGTDLRALRLTGNGLAAR